MAEKPDQNDTEVKPPALAQLLLAIAAHKTDKTVLIGDLQEEFALLARRVPQNAKIWYWRQTVMSLPSLVLNRLRNLDMMKVVIPVMAVIAALLLIRYWDIWVARKAAQNFAAMTQATSFFIIRAVYLLVQMAGIAIAGAIIAAATFRKSFSFLDNALRRLAPAGLALFAPTLFAIVIQSDPYPLSFRLIWLSLATPALIIGAYVYNAFFAQHLR